MTENLYFKRKKKRILLISFIFIFNLISIIFLPSSVIIIKDIKKSFDNVIDDNTFFIQTSSGGPPNRAYFKYYKVITIDNAKVSGSGNHKNYPVLISLFDSDLHDNVQLNGEDIAFSNDTAWLDHELELFKKDYNGTHAHLVTWVRIPSLSTSTDTKFYMYYSNSTMGARENPSGVWEGNFKGVWHLSEDPTGTIYDSTSNNNDGTSQGVMTSGDQVDGQIDGSLDFDGNDDNIRITDAASLDITSAITVEAWVNGTGNWWNSKYQYRKKINITNNYGSTVVANTIVKFTADTATLISTGKLRTDEKDWRIGYWDGYSWIELARDVYIGWDTSNTETWFRLQADITDGNSDNNYYVYYGYSDEIGTPTTLGLSEGIIKQQPAGGMGWDKAIDYMDNIEWGLAQAYSYSPSYTSWYVVTKISWYCSHEDSTTSQLLAGYIFDGINKLEGEEITNGKSATFTGSSVVKNAYNDAVFSKPYPQPERGSTYYMALFPDSSRTASMEPIFWAIELSAGNGAYWVIRSGTWTLWGSNGDFKYQLYGYEAPNNDCVASLGLEEQNGINKGNAPSLAFDNSNVAGLINNKVIFANIGAGWNYVVLTYDGTNQTLYVDGELRETSALTGAINTNINDLIIGDFFNGIIDEVRISSIARSADWIKTEFNNHHEPNRFYSVGNSTMVDNIPPKFSNLSESSDPLELGDTEIITINVTDLFGINQVLIENEGGNHSMTNIVGDLWQYDSWTPANLGNYTYTIYMEDINHNWNSTSGSIRVVDTTPPTYSNLIESADPLKLGQNETITIKVYDSPGSGVNQTILEYESLNYTMIFMGEETWNWNNWKPTSEGLFPYKIYMQDMQNNWNVTNGSITVITTTAPVIENLTESADPLELGNNITIAVDVSDNETSVSSVLIELEGVNYTMSNIGGNTYEYNWTRSLVGIVVYTIYANDTGNNWNKITSSFDIVDTTPPSFTDQIESQNPLELGNTEVISINATDLTGIKQIKIEFEGSNHSMSNIGGDTWQYNLWMPSTTGNYFYTIWIEDNNNNWNFSLGSIIVQDTIAPFYSNLTKSADPVELGTILIININITDLSNIKRALIEFEGSNHSMINIGGDLWQYDSWMPNKIGNYSYTIHMEDNNNNWNSTSGSIIFQDTISPVYSNLFESADPLELGESILIRIDTNDFAGINQSLIEFEGSNHTMINIYGNTWQYDSWTPNNWIIYQYKIYIEDNSGNWNFTNGNITVYDTTPPLPPVITMAPSGDVSGILTFDWIDGFDPSGISYYILIIDNEPDPFITPGYVFIFNITNISPESSYCELPETLPQGKYYYFLAQVDGLGHQSSYTTGTFTVVSTNNNLMIYIIIGITLMSIIGLVSTAIIVKKRTKKDVLPQKEKIPFKIVISHINNISSSQFISEKEGSKKKLIKKETDKTFWDEEFLDEKELGNRLNEIRLLGEELFADGAYLEAQKQFEEAEKLLLKFNKKEEASLYSDLIAGIQGLIEERESRLAKLEQEKLEGNSMNIFNLYYDIIEISRKLKDADGVSMYQSELIQLLRDGKVEFTDLEYQRLNLEDQANALLNDNLFERAAKIFEKCEKISHFLVRSGNDPEKTNLEKFRNKKNECLKKTK
ncbi:MAG: DUF2341 domain-containing protein [Candidatus Hodarchaeota archaeon]